MSFASIFGTLVLAWIGRLQDSPTAEQSNLQDPGGKTVAEQQLRYPESCLPRWVKQRSGWPTDPKEMSLGPSRGIIQHFRFIKST
jgi:hypothetical protein